MKERRRREPFYIILRNYKVYSVVILTFFIHLSYEMWYWFELNHSGLTTQAAGVYGSMVLMVIGTVKYTLEHMMQDWKLHDDIYCETLKKAQSDDNR